METDNWDNWFDLEDITFKIKGKMEPGEKLRLSTKAIETLQEKLGDSICIEKYSFEGEANQCNSVYNTLSLTKDDKATTLPQKAVVRLNVTLSVALEYPFDVPVLTPIAGIGKKTSKKLSRKSANVIAQNSKALEKMLAQKRKKPLPGKRAVNIS